MDGIPQGAKDGDAVISMDGWTDICSCNICTSTILGGRIPQRATDGGALSPWMEWQITSPCVICTSCIHAGRMLKIVWNDFSVYPWMTAHADGSPSTLFTAISSVYRNKIHLHPVRRETAAGHNHTPRPSQPVFLSRPHHCRRYYSVLKISLSDPDFHP